MADISILSRLVNGVQRNVDLQQNTLVVGSLKVGSITPSELTQAILDKLINLQTGGFEAPAASYHIHDGRYFTETELSSSAASSGSDLIGDDNTYSNFTPAAATVKGALSGIDTALATSGGRVKITASDTLADYLDPSLLVDIGSNSTNALEKLVLNSGANEQLRIRFDVSKVDHGSLAGLGDDDHAIYIKADGTRAFTGAQSMGGFKLTNVADPTANGDAVNLGYLNARLSGLTPKAPARAATTANITLSGAQTIDTVSIVAGNRVLVKNQTLAEENGLYVAAAGAWSRATDMDALTPFDEFNGAWTSIQEGSQAGQVFVQYGTVATVGTDPVNWAWYNPIAGLIGGDMITFSGSTFSVDLATVSGLESTNAGNAAGQLRVKLDGSSLSISASGLKVAAGGITGTELNASVAGAGLTGGGGSPLAVGAGDGITVAADSIAVDASAIAGTGLENDGSNNLRIAASAAGAGLTGGAGSALAVGANADGSIIVNADDIQVAHAPAVKSAAEVAGEAFSASTLYAVRYGQNAETAGRMYKADKDATSTDNFNVIGLVKTSGALSAADPMPAITKIGLLTATSHGFTVGKPVFLDASGALTSTAPTTTNHAVVRVGIVKDANTIDVQIQVVGVN